MAERESYRSRQDNEFQAIQSIFGNDVQDQRPSGGAWKPLNVRIRLGPQMGGSSDGCVAHVQTTLHVICPSKYPRLAPKIQLTDTKGLSDQQAEALTKALLDLAQQQKGDEVLFMLAQHVQEFLHAHNKPPAGSLYDEMIQDRQVRRSVQEVAAQQQRQLQQQQFTAEQQTIRDMVMQRKEMFHSEPRRRDMRRSISEASPTHPHHSHHHHHRSNSSSDNSENSSGDGMTVMMAPGAGGHYRAPLIYPNACVDHRCSEVLYMLNVARRIQRGCCLGHSPRGCVAYTALDLETGQPLYLTEWTLRYAQLEHKCLHNCARTAVDGRCSGHTVDELCQHIERQCASLSQLRHRHLASYECVHYQKRKDGIVLYLVQDMVFGSSVASLTASLGWCAEGASTVARGVLDALLYLHNQGVSHNNLSDSTVFVDSSGTVRVTDFSLVPMLVDLLTTAAPPTTHNNTGSEAAAAGDADASPARHLENDLPALGSLMEAMLPVLLHADMAEFVERCKSARTLSAADLLEHPFVRASLQTTADHQLGVRGASAFGGTVADRRQSLAGRVPTALPAVAAVAAAASSRSGAPSRLNTEFEKLQWLGKGAFGDVLKVRNILDNREYAIKRIPLEPKTRIYLQRKMTREVELLSRLNHENVVRYYNSWLESACLADARQDDSDDDGEGAEEEEDDESVLVAAAEKCSMADATATDKCGVKLVIPRLTVHSSSSSSPSSSKDVWLDGSDSSSSDGIEFQNSDGEVVELPDDDETDDTTIDRSKSSNNTRSMRKSPRPEPQIMYIQMEFCEKSTLRSAIDAHICNEPERLWRLFREITEGLAHIHQQGIIHRDLKPVNIFLDSRDQVKIGDFGLATTSLMALQTHEPGTETPTASRSIQRPADQQSGDAGEVAAIGGGSSLTGKVGTALYVAPELVENCASRSTYNQRVDLYSLGIIFFEMCHPPFATAMERHQVITALRSPAVVVPAEMLGDAAAVQQVKVLRWLLVHEADKRPTAELLLTSDLMPPAELEANELQEMLRHALANSQSKAYKNLVARCLAQPADAVLEMTYHLSFGLRSVEMEALKMRVVALFRRHGAEETTTPLLWPAPPRTPVCSAVRLMTHSGSVVQLPQNLRVPFIKHVATTTTDRLRRYAIGRVYHEKKMFYFHPKQQYECAFDVITPQRGNLLADAECIAMAAEIATEYTRLSPKAVTFRMNHTGLLRAAMLHSNVPAGKYADVFDAMLDHLEGRATRFQLAGVLAGVMPTKQSVSALIELMSMEFTLSGSRSSAAATMYRVLLRSRCEIAELARAAIKEMETVVAYAQLLGVTCAVVATIGLPIHYERCKSGGIVWQMMANIKSGRKKAAVLAEGGRYDDMLAEHQQKAVDCGINAHQTRVKCGVGFSLALDKVLTQCAHQTTVRSIDVCVLCWAKTPMRETVLVLRALWRAGFRTGIVEEASADEAQDVARGMHVPHVVLVDEQKVVHVRSWSTAGGSGGDGDGAGSVGGGGRGQRRAYREHSVTNRQELVEYVQRLLAEEAMATAAEAGGSGGTSHGGLGGLGGLGERPAANGLGGPLSLGAAASSASGLSGSGGSGGAGGGAGTVGSASGGTLGGATGATYHVTFVTLLRQTVHSRRRLENQMVQNMTETLMQFGRREVVHVLAVDLPANVLRALAGAVDRRAAAHENAEEIAVVMERYPRRRDYLETISDHVLKCLNSDKQTIVALYSVIDASYKLIL